MINLRYHDNPVRFSYLFCSVCCHGLRQVAQYADAYAYVYVRYRSFDGWCHLSIASGMIQYYSWYIQYCSIVSYGGVSWIHHRFSHADFSLTSSNVFHSLIEVVDCIPYSMYSTRYGGSYHCHIPLLLTMYQRPSHHERVQYHWSIEHF
jgi:hypothetical protein